MSDQANSGEFNDPEATLDKMIRASAAHHATLYNYFREQAKMFRYLRDMIQQNEEMTAEALGSTREELVSGIEGRPGDECDVGEEGEPREIRAVFVDMDGVLVDFVGGAAEALVPPGVQPDIRQWDWHKSMGGTEAEFWKKIHDLGADFWANLKRTADGDDILRAAEKGVGIKSVYLLTSPADSPHSWAGKRIWVQRNLPEYADRLIMTRQKRILAGPDRILIDDNDANVVQFAEHGGYAILIPRPWNSRRNLCTYSAARIVADCIRNIRLKLE